MTRSELLKEFESGSGTLFGLLRILVLFGGIFFLLFTAILGLLTWPQQAVLGLLTVLLAVWMDRSSTSYSGHAHAAVCVVLLDISLWVLAALDYSEFLLRSREPLFRSRYLLHRAAGWGGGVCIRHPVSSDTCRRYGRCAARRFRCRTIQASGQLSTCSFRHTTSL